MRLLGSRTGRRHHAPDAAMPGPVARRVGGGRFGPLVVAGTLAREARRRRVIDGGPRVLVVTAAMGAGHTEVAAELSRRLAERGARVEVVDLIAAAGPAGARLRRTYRLLLAYAPWLYDAAMRFWARVPRPLETLTAAGSRPFERALRDAAARSRPDVVVSTYDLASQALGRLAGRGELTAPIVTYLCDPGAHPYWIGSQVRTHLVLTELTAHRMRGYGAAGVELVRPVLRPQFDTPPSRAQARSGLNLSPQHRIALVTAGSWAVGGIEPTVRRLAGTPGLVLLVLCGHDDELRRRLASEPGVVAVPWTDRMVDYLAAADVVIDNAGGLTCWEALACHTPVLLHHPLPGHGRFNVATLDAAGLARHVQRADRLGEAVAAAAGTVGRLPDPAAAGDAVERILAVARTGHGAAFASPGG
jgi:UDP-N-acetylglucosamine:LPS N-acetylglucosamine transferase